MKTVVDYALWPLLLAAPVLAARALVGRGLPNWLVTVLVVGALAAIVTVLERVRPEREEFKKPDRPLWMEAGHFVLGLELGYGLALVACGAIAGVARAHLPVPSWPSHWPLALQLLLALALYEGTSYWQHRAFHRFPALWGFHALHHSGERMSFVRAVRFHLVDFVAASFVAYLPLVLLDAPDDFFTVLSVLLSALGILQHANVRMRTPFWIDWLLCTPAVHRRHHSRARAENDTNFGNSVMIFDLLFGTFGRPTRPEGPVALGIDDDHVPAAFLGQLFSPFSRRRPIG